MCAAIRDGTRVFKQQHPSKRLENTGQRDLNMRLSATRRRSNASCAEISTFLAVPRCSCLHQHLLTYILSLAANLRLSFGIQLTLVEEETWRRGEGPRESGWATPRPHVPARPTKIVCAQQTSHPVLTTFPTAQTSKIESVLPCCYH